MGAEAGVWQIGQMSRSASSTLGPRYPQMQAMEAAMTEARRYLKSSPMSLRQMKKLVWHGLERDMAQHMKAHVEALSGCFKSADHKEGVAAFLEKRPANFTGR